MNTHTILRYISYIYTPTYRSRQPLPVEYFTICNLQPPSSRIAKWLHQPQTVHQLFLDFRLHSYGQLSTDPTAEL